MAIGVCTSPIEYKCKQLKKIENSLVSVHMVLGVSRYGADGVLLPVAANRLRAVGVLPAAAVAELLHHWVDLGLEHLGQLQSWGNVLDLAEVDDRNNTGNNRGFPNFNLLKSPCALAYYTSW